MLPVRHRGLPDADLPMLAARWLGEGWQSESLVELAGVSRAEAHHDARRLLPTVLTSFGFPVSAEWRVSAVGRYSALVGWVVRVMNGPFVPCSAAQKVLEAADDDPQTFERMPSLDSAVTQPDTADRRSPTLRPAAAVGDRFVEPGSAVHQQFPVRSQSARRSQQAVSVQRMPTLFLQVGGGVEQNAQVSRLRPREPG